MAVVLTYWHGMHDGGYKLGLIVGKRRIQFWSQSAAGTYGNNMIPCGPQSRFKQGKAATNRFHNELAMYVPAK